MHTILVLYGNDQRSINLFLFARHKLEASFAPDARLTARTQQDNMAMAPCEHAQAWATTLQR